MLMTQQQALQTEPARLNSGGAIFTDVSFGFLPAFKNIRTQQIHLSLDHQGQLSCMHLFDRLPADWIQDRDARGDAMSLSQDIIVGFMRNAQFYTLSELMSELRDS